MLSGGQFEWQSSQQRSRQPVVALRSGWPGIADFAVPALDQCPLKPDGLVEDQTFPRPVPLVSRSARCIARSASSSEIRFRCRTTLSGSGSVDRIEDVEHLAHARVDVPALHLGARGIDREEVPLERRQDFVLAGRRFGDLPATCCLPLPVPSRTRNAGWVSSSCP